MGRLGKFAVSRDTPIPSAESPFRPTANNFSAHGWDRSFRLWDVASGRQVREWTGKHEGSRLQSIAFHPDGLQALGCCFDDKWVRLYDLKSGQSLRSCEGHEQGVVDVAVSVDGRKGVSCSLDRTAFVWDLKTSKPLHRLEGSTDGLETVAFFPRRPQGSDRRDGKRSYHSLGR